VALTPDELAAVRAEIGAVTPPTDADLDAIHDRLGSPVAVVREVLSKRLADRLAAPQSFSIPGDYSESWNIDALQKQLAALGGSGMGGTVQVGVQVREDPAR
jgi:hypothetical protein